VWSFCVVVLCVCEGGGRSRGRLWCCSCVCVCVCDVVLFNLTVNPGGLLSLLVVCV